MDQVGSVEIVIKGGRPWGFTLQGGIESRSALTVSQIEPRGKAGRHGALKVGDHVLKINDVQCFSLADATQLIDCAFRTLTVLVWRSKSTVAVPCPQVRDSSRFSGPRYHRHSKHEGPVVRRTSVANSKVLPRVITKDHHHRHKPQEPSTDTGPINKVTLTCDSHQNWSECHESGSQRNLGNSSDHPFHSSAHSLISDRSNSALSLASTTDSQEDVLFQTHESTNRYTRSPRNLTKDSGYETCAQTEHDYVNMEWISSPQVSSRPPLSSPVGNSRPKKSAIANQLPVPPGDYFPRYPAMDNCCQQLDLERYDKASLKYHCTESKLGISYCRDCNESGIPSASVPFSKRLGSCASLYSSSESLSSRSSQADTAQIRPSKSSLSLTGKRPSVPVHVPQVLSSCQYFDKVVGPAQSAPNLHCKGEMVPRRLNKKQSVYEELACKSGFDFSPVIQRQSFWAQKQAFEGNVFLETTYPSRCYKVEEQELNSLPANCDKVRTCETIRSYYSSVETIRNAESSPQEGETSSPPPPVPTRDSSLRYQNHPTHEKFPSWPVSTSVESEVECPQSSGYRSNSWTEQTRCAKDVSESYSRPKTHFQISTQQLPPVQEKVKKSSRKAFIKNDQLGDQSCSKFTSERRFPSNETFDMLANRFTLDSIYRNSEDIFYSNEKQYDAHSPPERDVSSPLEKVASKQIKNNTYKKEYENVSPKACDIYENLRKLEDTTKDGNSNTPLLDRLRLESFPSWSRRQDTDAFSDSGTCISSNSSSQETLKWHGSYTDLIPSAVRTRNESLGSDSSTIYEELRPRSVDGSEKSYSTLCSSPSGYSTENYANKTSEWQQFSAIPYSSPDLKGELTESTGDEHCALGQSKICRYDLQTSNSRHSFREVTEETHDSNRNGSLFLSPGCHSRGRADETKETSLISVCCSKPSENSTDRNGFNIAVPSKTQHGSKVHDSYYSSKYTSNNCPSQRQHANTFRNSPSEKSNSFSWELKAIQKQAVLSFYHRQTAIVAKERSDKKAPRSSSFSYTRYNAAIDKSVPSTVVPVAQNRRKKFLSSNSFSQQISDCCTLQELPDSSNNAVKCGSTLVGNVPDASISSDRTMPHSSDGSNWQHSSAAPTSDLPKPEVPSDSKKVEGEAKASESARQADPDSDNQSDRILRLPITARKAYLKKTCKPNENVVVRVLSSQGVTLAKCKTETRTSLGYPNVKPQVPPKRVQKDSSVVPLSHQVCSFPSFLSSPENTEDEELQAIEDSMPPKIGILAPSGKTMASSPDLPLPPPPANTGMEILPTDDPFPPPPDLQELSGPEINQAPCCFTYSRMDGSLNNESNTHPPCNLLDTSISAPRTSIQIKKMQVSMTESGLDRTDELLPVSDSSPATSAFQSQDIQVMQRTVKQNEGEAVYVNLCFQKKQCENIFAESAPKTSDIPSTVSVTNSATQTSEATPSLQRRANNLTKAADRVVCSRLCFSNPSVYAINNIPTSEKPNYQHNSLTELPVQDQRPANDIDYSNTFSHSLSQVSVQESSSCALRDEIGLPLTNPYFTTSEPKAKLLTRYCQDLDKQWSDQLELKGQKEELIASISKKLNVLRLEQIELKEEMKQNEDLGQEVTAKIEKIAKPNEVQKYRIHVEELEKIINLLLSLSGRLARAENALLILPKDAKAEEKNILEAKRNKLSQQHDEAWHLKENIDRRSCQVSLFLHHYLSKEEYADYEHFIKMKSKLLMDAREIDEKIRLGEEQLAALHGTFQAPHLNVEVGDKTAGEFTVLAKA